jgi:hypothetical protein
MHRELNAAAPQSPQIRQWQQTLDETRVRENEESALFDRELFYALQPRDRLEAMVSRFAEAFAKP